MSNHHIAEVNEVRTKERVKITGEVFTDPELVKEILNKLEPSLFIDPTKTFCDPACGTGNFLVEVIKLKIVNGSTPTQALETTYGVELMEDNCNVCRMRLLEICGDSDHHLDIVTKNVVNANSLEYDFSFGENGHDVVSQDDLNESLFGL